MSEISSNPLTAFSNAMVEAVEKAGVATVLVDARKRMPASGISYAPDLVLTADHVVEQEEDIHILLPDGSQIAAVLAGRDPNNDLALLRLNDPKSSPSMTVAEPVASPARVGELALALGRPSADGIQASLGVVSALGGPVRTGRGGMIEQYIRTDTVFYPGFSGGPLINAAGQVLGINTSGLAHGVALTIPSGLAWQVADALARNGRVRRGYLGVRSQSVNIPSAQQQALGRNQAEGLLLVGIEEGSPAEQAGLLVGDILVAFVGQPVTDADNLHTHLISLSVGQASVLEILRGGKPTQVTVIVGERN